ncbi:unnamed protein product [Caenorhabditis angaria]|uniref:ATPase AAA-type core domain-containing protein n=1 Tax=Caenorhabditis angaria TaxID=860376 RepID=A0A9P1IRQ8_9PELO|nr:unnamed protein product [Caenorhabditis angaria]
MGCQISSDGNFETPPNYEEFWNQRKHRNQVVRQNNSQRKGWKIVRILVVSTYKDFKNERSAVLSMIERQIQPVAAEKLIFLQVEDLAYGSKNYIDEIANIYLIAKCCCDDNKIAIYCHFLGECAGFVIDSTFSDESFLQQNEIKYGQTFSETFLQLNAVDSNNSLFLHRNPDFLYELPFNVTNFVDPQKGRERAQHFAQSVKKHVKPASLLEYSVKTSGINNTHFKQILFDDLSKATDPLRSLIDSFIEKFPYSEDIKTLTVNQKIRDFYQNSSSKRISNILQKINSNIKNHRNTVIFGDYSTGKTTILYKILKEHGSAVFIKAEEGMNIRQELERKLGMFIQEIDEPKIRHLILIDDIHNLSTDLSSYTHLTIIGTSRKRKSACQIRNSSKSPLKNPKIFKNCSRSSQVPNRRQQIFCDSQESADEKVWEVSKRVRMNQIGMI